MATPLIRRGVYQIYNENSMVLVGFAVHRNALGISHPARTMLFLALWVLLCHLTGNLYLLY
jgi:hypothetical protein